MTPTPGTGLITVWTARVNKGRQDTAEKKLQYAETGWRACHRTEEYSLKLKKQLTVGSLILCVLCTYFFIRHTTRCEPLMYTLFSLTEYIVVLCNMGFHMTAYWDFADKALYVSNIQWEGTGDKVS
ncbi:hypothetical protein HPB51_017069 [Rhipicephalus microplus]|uniref:CWH43-like N-terminal domain-containing protein n=1 Tax=Rhipicephalus microplus TaxID=6941 RepID=A0A9J6F7M4_RHIMP|nr:hypothetical protein HPB51_017069 [Rhipicephalus microplus]